ncbi:MAG: 23S rRNA (adenine(2030)-N(6))-methyltransferase RlmJ [Rhodovarius sp.]|nr:23S rRNA (adenine(2030)-N(6))-methyltransferase RlmJ [Rhodovarius sp.]MDW8313432.1 23S rRNA (adenine(2030)-N(6))-methyltransferase RlmJ [Rhodovarius sp.]
MNYRHAFHAGNFADCMKHALLCAIVEALKRKPTPIRVLDTHAGRGLYDLSAPEALRSGEWHEGVARLITLADGPLAPFVTLVASHGAPRRYPGSPMLLEALLRPQDALVLNELQPEEAAQLKRHLPHRPVHRRDAYECARALTPFPERRGLVFYDPPYERTDEFERLSAAIAQVWRRARGHIQAAWYPIKHLAPIHAFHHALREAGLRDVVAAELWLREPLNAARLNGCGLVVVNPPYGFESEGMALLQALLDRLSDGEEGAGVRIARIADE